MHIFMTTPMHFSIGDLYHSRGIHFQNKNVNRNGFFSGLGRSLDPNMDLVWKATPYILQSKLKESYFRPKPTDATDASLLE